MGQKKEAAEKDRRADRNNHMHGKELAIGCWLEPKTNTAYKCHDMKSMIIFFFLALAMFLFAHFLSAF